ncbi:MAG TPA: ECF transporter S component [Candidatus Eisenbacteria bacterium]|nr:ECF transporter S component [Candidatus Eisenbacteria bacterium]
MNSRKIAVIASLAALSVATNYAMVSFSNVKLMDFIVFIAGFSFGPLVGALTGIFSWSVYGPLNPNGFSLPIWLATMFSETLYGVIGGLIRRKMGSEAVQDARKYRVNLSLSFGALAVFMTLLYDIITNAVFGILAYGNIVYAIIIGFVPFGLLHVLSNFAFFGLGCAPTIGAVMKITGGEQTGIADK